MFRAIRSCESPTVSLINYFAFVWCFVYLCAHIQLYLEITLKIIIPVFTKIKHIPFQFKIDVAALTCLN